MSGTLWASPTATSVLAIITTVHLGIFLLCIHRGTDHLSTT